MKYHEFFIQHWATLQQAPLYTPRPNPTFGNPPFEAAPFRALIVRLSPFRDVERSTPHLFLFQAARRALPGAYVDMAFFPPQRDREAFLRAGVPLLVGTQSWRGAADFDVVLISNAYTLELINLPYLLLNSGIPVWAGARGADFPPLLLGGSNALATQAILTPEGDCMADALFFGEGEREVETLLRLLSENAHLPKRDRLRAAAAQTTGLWVANGLNGQKSVPSVESVQSVESLLRVVKAICPAPQSADLLTTYPLLNGEEAGAARLQLNFGCPAFCSFCFEGYDRKPYREVAQADVLAAARRLKRNGAAAVDLYSFNFNTQQEILPLLLELNRMFERVSFKSQRVDVLASAPGMLEAEVVADKRSFTLGIEGISRRMRAFLHKSLSDAAINGVLARLLRQKIREIKLFYILTGHETEADLAEFRDFVRDLRDAQQRANRGLRVIFSFGLLVRMPFTPLRYDRLFLDEAEWRRITGPVKSACETNGFEFRLAAPWDEYAASQVLALGGYWLHAPVLALAEQGHCYDLSLTPGYWDALRGWLAENGYWDAAFLGEKGPEYAFPLEFVQQRIAPEYLYKKYRQAMAGEDEGYCLGEIGQVDGPARCLGCDACATPQERAAILTHALKLPGGTYLRDLEAVMAAKWRLKPVYARLWLPPDVAGADPAWLNAWVMQQLLQAYPAWEDNLLAVQESLFTTKDAIRRYAGLYGETVFALKAWDVGAMGRVGEGESGRMGAVRFLGWMEGFAAGTFARMALRLTLPAAHFPEAGPQLRKFLQDAYVPVNLRRAGGGVRLRCSRKGAQEEGAAGGRGHAG